MVRRFDLGLNDQPLSSSSKNRTTTRTFGSVQDAIAMVPHGLDGTDEEPQPPPPQ